MNFNKNFAFDNWTTKSLNEVFKELNSSPNGLSNAEVKERLNILGFNELKVKSLNLFNIFLRQLKSPFSYLLIIVAIVFFLMGEKTNSLIILVFVLLNIILGFLQEAKASKVVFYLRTYIPSMTKVMRNKLKIIIDKKFLVKGDIVFLVAGDVAPADLRVLNVNNVLIDESTLTGESSAVTKVAEPLAKKSKEIFKANNIIFTGTSIISGKVSGIVINTAKDTELGKISNLVSSINRESAYERNLMKFSRIILRIILFTIVAIFLANLIIKGGSNFTEFLIFTITLIVGIVPEALPTVVIFSLSRGALRLAKERIIIKRLSAVEDLGNVEVLCTDKTGTITENKLILNQIYSSDQDKCLLYALLSTTFFKENIKNKNEKNFLNEPFDSAILEKLSSVNKKELKKFKFIKEIPFDPFTRKSSCIVQNNQGKIILIVKGAPEVILKLALNNGKIKKNDLKKEIGLNSEQGNRILAFAFKEFKKLDQVKESKLNFLGYFSFVDPLKKQAKQTIKLAQKLGVKIKILTGDNQNLAAAVAKDVDLIQDLNDAISGDKLESLSNASFDKACDQYSVFARVSPQTKYKIIKSLQKKYEVGFLGEGINDTPALKVANVGIVVKEAVDIAKEAADIVLLKKNLNVIIEGIKEGRSIFSNINKYIKCTLSSNFGNYYSMALISLIITFLPMLPIQILLINLLSDFPLIAVTYDSVDFEELRKPKVYQLSNLSFLLIILSLVSTIFDFIFFGFFHSVSPEVLRTAWYVFSIFTEVVLIFSVRTTGFFLKAAFPSLVLIISSLLILITTIVIPFINLGKEFFGFVKIPNNYFYIIFVMVLGYFCLSEAVKLIYFKYLMANTHR